MVTANDASYAKAASGSGQSYLWVLRVIPLCLYQQRVRKLDNFTKSAILAIASLKTGSRTRVDFSFRSPGAKARKRQPRVSKEAGSGLRGSVIR